MKKETWRKQIQSKTVYKSIFSYICIYLYIKNVHAHETIIIKAPINVNTMIRKDFSRIRDQTCTLVQENGGLYPKRMFINIQYSIKNDTTIHIAFNPHMHLSSYYSQVFVWFVLSLTSLFNPPLKAIQVWLWTMRERWMMKGKRPGHELTKQSKLNSWLIQKSPTNCQNN